MYANFSLVVGFGHVLILREKIRIPKEDNAVSKIEDELSGTFNEGMIRNEGVGIGGVTDQTFAPPDLSCNTLLPPPDQNPTIFDMRDGHQDIIEIIERVLVDLIDFLFSWVDTFGFAIFLTVS